MWCVYRGVGGVVWCGVVCVRVRACARVCVCVRVSERCGVRACVLSLVHVTGEWNAVSLYPTVTVSDTNQNPRHWLTSGRDVALINVTLKLHRSPVTLQRINCHLKNKNLPTIPSIPVFAYAHNGRKLTVSVCVCVCVRACVRACVCVYYAYI